MTTTQQATTYEVTISGATGVYRVTSAAMDAAMDKYLPASPRWLRAICEERSGCDYSDVKDVSVFVAMLADWDYNVDSSPLSVYAAG